MHLLAEHSSNGDELSHDRETMHHSLLSSLKGADQCAHLIISILKLRRAVWQSNHDLQFADGWPTSLRTHLELSNECC